MDKSNSVSSDEFGPDPLAQTKLDEICAIPNYYPVTIDAKYLGNPQLLAFDAYGNVELYFVILLYNGITNSFRLDRGMTVNVPDPNAVKEILSKTTKKVGAAKRMTI